MDPIVFNLIGAALVVAVLAPALHGASKRMREAEELLADDPEALAGFRATRGDTLPVLLFLGGATVLVVAGLLIQRAVTAQIEPAADATGNVQLWFVIAPVPPILAVILVAVLISLARLGRTRSRYLNDLATHRPELSSVEFAAAALGGGQSRLGLAGATAVSIVACLMLGLGWIAMLFWAAGTAIQCARTSAKCL